MFQHTLRNAENLESITVKPGACSGGFEACYHLGYMLDDATLGTVDPTVSHVVLAENVCSRTDSICDHCLFEEKSADLPYSMAVLTIDDASQCPNGPFTYYP